MPVWAVLYRARDADGRMVACAGMFVAENASEAMERCRQAYDARQDFAVLHVCPMRGEPIG